MRRLYIFLAIVLISFSTYGQSISASKILSYLDSQSLTKIKSELASSGFKSMGQESDYNNIQIQSFMKSDRLGKEHIELGKNSELFMFVYKPVSKEYFTALKSKLLTSEFVFAYKLKNNKYYESENMRIGVNTKSNILSFFVALK